MGWGDLEMVMVSKVLRIHLMTWPMGWMKMLGENGQPCLILLEMLIFRFFEVLIVVVTQVTSKKKRERWRELFTRGVVVKIWYQI